MLNLKNQRTAELLTRINDLHDCICELGDPHAYRAIEEIQTVLKDEIRALKKDSDHLNSCMGCSIRLARLRALQAFLVDLTNVIFEESPTTENPVGDIIQRDLFKGFFDDE